MKTEIKKIIGKTIKGVAVGEGSRGTQSQIFLIFTDNTFYEIFSENHISVTSGLKKGGINAVLKSLPPKNEVIYNYDDSLLTTN